MERKRRAYFPEKPTKPPSGPTPKPPGGGPIPRVTICISIEKYESLLRVARAAEVAWPYMFGDMPKKRNHKRITYEKLYDALKELPDGLLEAE